VVPLINRESIPWSTKFCLADPTDPNVIICDNCSGPRFYGSIFFCLFCVLCEDFILQVLLKFAEDTTKTKRRANGHRTRNLINLHTLR
jgi:hypothetical protein